MSITNFAVEIRGLRLAGCQSRSDGRPLLLLHGSGASGRVFASQLESELGETFRLIALDLPGHGHSGDAADPTVAYTIGGMARFVSDFIDQLGLEEPAVYGWSLGGHLAMELASLRRDVAGLALSGAPPIGRGPVAALRGFHARWEMLLASKERFSSDDAERFWRLCYGAAGTPELLAEIRRSDGGVRKHFLSSMLRGHGVDQRRLVQTAQFPVLMLDGEDEHMIRRSYVERLHYANLWRGKCHTIAGAAHAPFLQNPAAFNRLLHLFMRDLNLARLQERAKSGSRFQA